MGIENQGSKAGGYVGGFFQLFDWSGKSRKKLFSNRSAVPEESKHGKQSDGKLPMARLLMIEDENSWGLSSAKESNSSSASSNMDDEESGIRAPGVVARLMGLNSLPNADVSEPHSDPFTKSHTLPNSHYQSRSPEFQTEYQGRSSNKKDNKLEGFSQKVVESRPQKLQKICLVEKNPIERFQTETLPLKSAKFPPRTHNKLLSPIKSSGFVSAKNAAQLMDAATKIIEPGLQASSRNKYPILGSSAIPVKDRDVEGNIPGSQRQSRPLEAPRRPVESSAIKYLKGKSMNKSWNGSDDAPNLRVGSAKRVPTFVPSFPECKSTATILSKVPVSSSKQEHAFPDESKSSGLKDKGKSISLAIQAKVNVQRRESLSSGSSLMSSQNSCNKTLLVQKVQDEPKFSQPLNNQPSNLKNKQKNPVPGSSGVLRQNNQKQNCLTNKDKLLSKPATSNQQGRTVVPGDASFRREQRKQTSSKDNAVSVRNSNNQANRVASTKVSGNSNYGFNEKASTGTPDLEQNISLSSTKNLVRKKRCSMEGDVHPEKNRFVDEFFVDEGDDRLLPTNAVMGECQKWREDNIRSLWSTDQTAASCSKNMDVVSFTFTSPMMPMPGSHSSIKTLEKQNMKSNLRASSHTEKNAPDPKNNIMSTSGSNIVGGDALSILLEQKLRELTSGAELASTNSPKVYNSGIAAATATASLLQDLISALNNGRVPKEHEMKQLTSLQNDNLGHKPSESECSSTYGQMMLNVNRKLHGPEAITDCRSTSIDTQKECLIYDHASPMSILESYFSNESCNSSQSWDSTHGCRHYSTFTGNLVRLRNPKQIHSLEAEAELSDSATSTLTQTTERKNSTKISFSDGHMRSTKSGLEYVREILNNAELMFEDFAVARASGIIDPHIFERLENWKIGPMVEGENKEIQGSCDKVLFNCIRECVNSKYSHYSTGGYIAWVRGMAMLGGRDALAEEVYREILGWSSMGDWMVDEIIEKDMSSHLGRWTDFESEKFEIGMEIEGEVLQALVDEVVMDVLV